jgi:hypothetical protein
METITLKKGDIIKYVYNGKFDYAFWLGLDKEGRTIQQLSNTPTSGTLVIQGVWKKDVFEPRKKVTIT